MFVVLLPFFLLTLSSLYLTFVLYRSKKKLFKKVNQAQTRTTTAHGNSLNGLEETVIAQKSDMQKIGNQTKNQTSAAAKSNKTNFQFSFTLLMLNTCFLVLNLPSSVINLIKTYGDINTTEINFIYTLATIIRYCYFSFSFLAHFFSNRLVRESFFNIFKCKGWHAAKW